MPIIVTPRDGDEKYLTLDNLPVVKERNLPHDFDNDPKDEWQPNRYGGAPSDEFFVPLVVREQWVAAPPTVPGEPLVHPVKYVRFVSTGTKMHRWPDVVQTLQVFQSFYMKARKLNDIPFNFMVDADGIAFEGRGWLEDAIRPPELDWLKGNCLDIAFIGDFKKLHNEPPWRMVKAALELVKFGVKKNAIVPNFEVIQYTDIPNAY